MKDIPINNSHVMDALNGFLWYYDNPMITRNIRLNGKELDRRYFTGSEYRDKIIKMAESHDGYPECSRGYNVKADRLDVLTQGKNNNEVAEIISKFNSLNTNLCSVLGARNNALTMMYPPDGFISWHNNANASAYNLIFSWSETGDGCFKYVDGHTGQEVVMQDKKGWQCKAGYFGAYGEPWYNLVYHAAETDCWRITVSYVFDRSDMSLGMQDEIIEEIMSDF